MKRNHLRGQTRRVNALPPHARELSRGHDQGMLASIQRVLLDEGKSDLCLACAYAVGVNDTAMLRKDGCGLARIRAAGIAPTEFRLRVLRNRSAAHRHRAQEARAGRSFPRQRGPVSGKRRFARSDLNSVASSQRDSNHSSALRATPGW